jgi:hypothetical protein
MKIGLPLLYCSPFRCPVGVINRTASHPRRRARQCTTLRACQVHPLTWQGCPVPDVGPNRRQQP